MASILETSRVNLVILDLMLPGEDGLVLCRRLRSFEILPVIMLTAISDEMDRIIGLEMGADDYLAKGAPIPANCWPAGPRATSSAPAAAKPARRQWTKSGLLEFAVQRLRRDASSAVFGKERAGTVAGQ